MLRYSETVKKGEVHGTEAHVLWASNMRGPWAAAHSAHWINQP